LFIGVFARRIRHAKVQKFFGSFFQKRTIFLSLARAPLRKMLDCSCQAPGRAADGYKLGGVIGQHTERRSGPALAEGAVACNHRKGRPRQRHVELAALTRCLHQDLLAFPNAWPLLAARV
jgi:hypothetical protein